MGVYIVAIGTNHTLPVENPVEVAKRLSPLFDGPVSIGVYNGDWDEQKILFTDKPGETISMEIATPYEDEDEPFRLYSFDGKHLSFDIYKSIVEFDLKIDDIRWTPFYELFNTPVTEIDLEKIQNFRKHIFRQLQLCGCDKAYYFADEGPTQEIYDRLNLPSDEWLKYVESREYFHDDWEPPVFLNVSDWITHPECYDLKCWIDVFIDDFADLR